jgi:recombination protein RecA
VRDPADRADPSGSVGLDRAIGLVGLPRGHLTEYLGPESNGKTTLLYSALAATQRAGGLIALVDTEGSADGATLATCGVDLDGLLLARPTSARDALLLLTILARCGGLDALGLGSIAALRDLPSGSPTILRWSSAKRWTRRGC